MGQFNYTGKQLKSLFTTTSFLKVHAEDELHSIGVTVLFSDVTELQELRDAAVAFDKIKGFIQQLERRAVRGKEWILGQLWASLQGGSVFAE